MLPDLQHLIHLQKLDDFAEHARRTIADQPARSKALDDRVEGSRARVAASRQRAADNQAARRVLEKDLAAVQGRLSKFKDQLMEVKTNREYQAMQKEIEVAQQEVRGIEDRILERMIEADEAAAAVKQAEASLATEQKEVERERTAMEDEVARLGQELERSTTERQTILSQISPQVLATYQFIAQKRASVVAEARDETCTVCHVRLRPKVFNDVRRNDTIIQCESCQRILYFATPPPPAPENA